MPARTHAHMHTHTHTHTHARFEFDEFPESDKEEWLEGIRSAEEEQEQEQQNSMDMQRSGSVRGEDTEGGRVFEEHIS